MKISCFCIVVMLFLSQISFASPYLDSLYQVYYQVPTNEPSNYKERIELLKAISDYELHESPLKALPLIDTLAHLFKLRGNMERYYRELYRTKGFLYATAQNKLKALEYYQEYVKHCKKESTDDAYFLLDIGNLYYDFSLFSVAKIYYQEAEKIFTEQKFYRGLGTIYSNYSLIAQRHNQIDSALSYIEQTLYIQKHHVKDLLQIAHTYQVIGRIYSEKLKAYPKAIQYYQKALAIFEDRSLHKDPRRYNQFILYWPYTCMRLGKAYYGNNQLDSANYYIENALEIVEHLEKDHAYAFVAINIGEFYLKQNKVEQAQTLLLEVEKIAFKSGNEISLERCYKALNRLYTDKKEYKEAVRYARLYETMRDSVQKKQDKFFITTDGLLQKEKNEQIVQQKQIILSEQKIRKGLYLSLFLTGIILMSILFFGLKLRQKNKAIERYADDLKANNKIKEIILSVIGHDLRSPFGVISNIAGLLQKNLKEKDYKASDKLVDLLYDSSKKAYSMVDELMQWTTLQKETPLVKTEPVELQKVIRETIQQLGTLLEQGNITIKTDVAPVYCQTDAVLVQIILRNILTNAIKYTPFGGEIMIQTQWKDGTYVLQVEDSGVGIDEDLLGQIFDGKDSLEVVKKTSGLGLIIVRDLCQKIHWEIRAFNRKGSGAVFELGNLSLLNEPIPEELRSEHKVSEQWSVLSNSNQLLLQPYVQQFLNCAVFETTKIRKIIQQIEMPNQEILDWMKNFDLIINQLDDETYRVFLNRALLNEKPKKIG